MKILIFQINYLAKIVIAILTLIGVPGILHAENPQREDLYDEALKAYISKDYSNALKKFYAFSIIDKSYLSQHPDLRKKIYVKMELSQKIISTALTSMRNTNVRSKYFNKKEGGVIIIGTAREIEELQQSGKLNLTQ